jgi:Tfp pilus assembly protein PilO
MNFNMRRKPKQKQIKNTMSTKSDAAEAKAEAAAEAKEVKAAADTAAKLAKASPLTARLKALLDEVDELPKDNPIHVDNVKLAIGNAITPLQALEESYVLNQKP